MTSVSTAQRAVCHPSSTGPKLFPLGKVKRGDSMKYLNSRTPNEPPVCSLLGAMTSPYSLLRVPAFS